MPPADVRRRVEEILAFLGLSDHIDRMPSLLSGGQRRRVAIARAMAANPGILLLDDPTVGLDPLLSTTVDDEIVKLRDLQHVTSIVATHQMRDAYYVARHAAVSANGSARIEPIADGESEQVGFIVLHEGRIHFQGRGAELLESPDKYLEEFLYKTLPPW
jgi:phospholipid/cholesterol/gamma-HCH transport system ATP-binding protein